MIMAAVLLVSTVSVFAADVKKGETVIERKIEQQGKKEKEPVCSVTMETSLSAFGFSVKVSCTGSSTSCKEAIAIANSCLNEAKKQLMEY